MPRFFVDDIEGESARITGEDARHIARVLRLQPGKELTACDLKGTDYRCRIVRADPDLVELEILEASPCVSESPVRVRLYQALPKGDKLEQIVQKATELGVAEIVPVLTSRCISRPSERAFAKKRARLQRIAYEAAKQSGRGAVPAVWDLMDYEAALASTADSEMRLFCYEDSDRPLRTVLQGEPASVSLLIGSEGGFSAREAELAAEAGVQHASLGRRILRCETAPVCALSALFFFLGEF